MTKLWIDSNVDGKGMLIRTAIKRTRILIHARHNQQLSFIHKSIYRLRKSNINITGIRTNLETVCVVLFVTNCFISVTVPFSTLPHI